MPDPCVIANTRSPKEIVADGTEDTDTTTPNDGNQ